MSKTRAFSQTGDKAKDFENFGRARTGTAVKALRTLAKTGNRSSYAPTEAQIAAIEKTLQAEVKATIAALRHGYKGEATTFDF